MGDDGGDAGRSRGRKRHLAEGGDALRTAGGTSALLFFLLFAVVGGPGSAAGLSLGLGFLDALFHFSGALGAGFGTLLAFFFLQFLAAQQFDESVVGAVALAPAGADDAQDSRLRDRRSAGRWCRTVCRRRRWSSGRRGAWRRAAKSPRLPSVIIFSTCGRMALALGTRGLDALFENERSDQVPQQRAAVRGVTSQFPSCYFVTHG